MQLIIITLVRFLLRFIAPLILPLILPFASKVGVIVNPKDQTEIMRYKLPKIFSWLETPDEMLPGGMYEPTLKDIYDKWGWFIASWYWLGIRNVAFGLPWKYGKPVSNYMVWLSEEEKLKYGVYEKRTHFLGLAFITGYGVYRDWFSVSTKDGFWAIKRFSIRLASQD